jgi:CarD family transcriptional regulator
LPVYEPGQTVAYLTHGVGTIERRETRELLGESREVLVIRFHESDMVVVVPVERAEDAGLRPVMGAEGAQEVEKVLRIPARPQGGIWSHRYNRNQDKLKEADPVQTAEVVRDLATLDAAGKISSGEFGMLKRAKTLLSEELSYGWGIDREAARERLEDILGEQLAAAA